MARSYELLLSTRRHFFRRCGVGLGQMALASLLSDSLPSYEMVWTVNAAAHTFIVGRAMIGRLTVDTGAGTFTLPLAVQIEQP